MSLKEEIEAKFLCDVRETLSFEYNFDVVW